MCHPAVVKIHRPIFTSLRGASRCGEDTQTNFHFLTCGIPLWWRYTGQFSLPYVRHPAVVKTHRPIFTSLRAASRCGEDTQTNFHFLTWGITLWWRYTGQLSLPYVGHPAVVKIHRPIFTSLRGASRCGVDIKTNNSRQSNYFVVSFSHHSL